MKEPTIEQLCLKLSDATQDAYNAAHAAFDVAFYAARAEDDAIRAEHHAELAKVQS